MENGLISAHVLNAEARVSELQPTRSEASLVRFKRKPHKPEETPGDMWLRCQTVIAGPFRRPARSTGALFVARQAIVSGALLILSASSTQAQPAPPPTVQILKPPKIEVRVRNSSLTVLNDVLISISVTVTDQTTMLGISRITIDGPDNSTQPEMVLENDKEDKEFYAYVNYGLPWSKEVTQAVPKGIHGWRSAITHVASDSGSVNVHVSYTVYPALGGDQPLTTGVASDAVDLDYQAPFLVLLFGIGAGAALLMVLLALGRNLRSRKGAADEKLTAQHTPSVWLKDWIATVVSGVIILFTTQFTKILKLPITIDVRDFYGAIVLGLFSWKMIIPLSLALGSQSRGQLFGKLVPNRHKQTPAGERHPGQEQNPPSPGAADTER